MTKDKRMTKLCTRFPVMLGVAVSTLLMGASPQLMAPSTGSPLTSAGTDGTEDCANPPGDCCWTCPKGYQPNCDCDQLDDMTDPPPGYNRVLWDGAFTTQSSGPCGPGGRYFGKAIPNSNLPADYLSARAVQNCGASGDSKDDPNGYLRVGTAAHDSQVYLELYGQELGVLPGCVKDRAYDNKILNGYLTLAFRVRRVSDGCASIGLGHLNVDSEVETLFEIPAVTLDQWEAHYISIPLVELPGNWESVSPMVYFVQWHGPDRAEVHYDDLQITITETSLTSLQPHDSTNDTCAIPEVSPQCELWVKLICCDHWNGGGRENYLIDDEYDCSGDLNDDGVVDVNDLLMALDGYSRVYGVDDVLQILAAWGPCPCQ